MVKIIWTLSGFNFSAISSLWRRHNSLDCTDFNQCGVRRWRRIVSPLIMTRNGNEMLMYLQMCICFTYLVSNYSLNSIFFAILIHYENIKGPSIRDVGNFEGGPEEGSENCRYGSIWWGEGSKTSDINNKDWQFWNCSCLNWNLSKFENTGCSNSNCTKTNTY